MYPTSQRTPGGINHLRTNSSTTSSSAVAALTTTATTARVPLSTAAYREQLINNRYNLTHPNGVYPLDPTPNGSATGPAAVNQHRYPDFQPWKASPRDEALAITHLQQGYAELPFVSNEFVSARNIMHNLLQSRNALPDLSSNFLKVIQTRSANNVVPQSSFKTPPRVTLTDQKREAWLRDLANNRVPLRKLSRTIPHGIRNKSLIEHCIVKNIPMNRAIWLVKCVSANELKTLRRKGSTASATVSGTNTSAVEFNWISEWTNQVVEFLEKLSLDYLKFESFVKAKESWKFKIQYFLRFLSNLYIEKLIDRDIFKNWLLNFFRNCQNFEIPLLLTTIKIFWREILKTDYLIKDFTEALMLKHHKVMNLKNLLDLKDSNLVINDMKLNDEIKQKLLKNFQKLIVQSFIQSVDNFIIPNHWNLLKNTLRSVLNNLEDPMTLKKFELITYRNESLMINYSISTEDSTSHDLVHKLDSIEKQKKFQPIDFNSIISMIFTDQEFTTANTAEEEWKLNLFNIIKWAITKYRTENHRVHLVTETLKKFKSNLQQSNIIQAKDVETEIMNIVFNQLFPVHNLQDINTSQLYFLLNELSSIKLFKSSTYMRKIISSGLVYLSNNEVEKAYHLAILCNLKFEKNSESVMILKKLSNNDCIFTALEERFKTVLQHLETNPYDVCHNIDFKTLEIGLKTKVASKYLLRLKNGNNIVDFPCFANIVTNFLKLNDLKSLCSFIQFFLFNKENQLITLRHLNLISELMMDFDKLFVMLTNDFEKFISQFILCFKSCTVIDENGCSSFTELWTQLKNYCSNFTDPAAASTLDELEVLKKTKTPLNVDLVSHDLIESQIGLTFEQFSDSQHKLFHNNFQVLIRNIFSNLSNSNQINSSLNLLKLLKDSNEVEFNKILFVFIKKKFTANSNEIFNYKPLYDLISFELISVKTLLDFFMNFGDNSMYYQFIMELLFKSYYHDSPSHYSHSLKLDLIRERFKQQHPELLINIIKISFIANVQPKSSSILMDLMHDKEEKLRIKSQYKPQCLDLFLHAMVHDRDVIVTFLEDSRNSDFKSIIIDILNNDFIPQTTSTSTVTDSTEGQTILLDELESHHPMIGSINEPSETNKNNNMARVRLNKLISNLKHFDRFNLPIFQLLFKLILQDEEEIGASLCYDKMLLSFVNNKNINGLFKLFGSLFELLKDGIKIKFIHFLESLFLHSKSFPLVKLGEEEEKDDGSEGGIEISLSVISEIIIKLSNGLMSIPLPDELIFSLDISLESLIKLVSQPQEKQNTQLLLDSIQLFLKIVIIHKQFIIGVIIERNSIKDGFLNNLVVLLSTKFLSQNLQLKNLLYDLILSIKSSLNQPGNSNNIKLPLSLTNLPSLSSSDEINPSVNNNNSPTGNFGDLEHQKQQDYEVFHNKNNLQDQNALSHLFVLNRSTMSFSELNIKPFEMLENSNPIGLINDTALSLQLFDAAIERKNPT